MFAEQPRFVWLLKNGTELEISLSDLHTGDIIVVNAGGIIRVDGIITDGMAAIDQHALTGEAQPDEKGVGDTVLAATIVLTGKIYIQVEKTGSETIACQIGDILNHTSEFELSLHTHGEQIADKTVLPTLAIGTLALLTLGSYSSIAVLSANFAEVIRVTTPIGMLNFLNLAPKDSILIKDGRSLELLNQVDIVVFDKTGTPTLEQPHLGTISDIVGDGINDSIALKKAKVSISLCGASTVATDTAQIILMDQSLIKLVHLFELARDFDKNQKNGLATTFAPGVVCVGGIFFSILVFSAL